jgi:hypothetical protein
MQKKAYLANPSIARFEIGATIGALCLGIDKPQDQVPGFLQVSFSAP